MSVLSARTRQKAWDIALAVSITVLAWLLQLTVLSNFTFQGAFCNLPLTMTILWGFVFGSRMPGIHPDELRLKGASEIFFHQLTSGSFSGLLFGAFFAAIASASLPIYPLSYPLIGWICGYFSLKKINPETLLCIPLVLLATVLADFITAFQLAITGHADVFSHLAQIALPEALLNALIAPFVYFPMLRWHDFNRTEPVSS
jgi:rod shape-determining protein MreD